MTYEPNYNVATITYIDEDTGLAFRWHGGAYIDVSPDADAAEATDVINVWDDEADASIFETREPMPTPSIRRPFRYVLEAFEDRCRAYIDEAMAEDDSAE